MRVRYVRDVSVRLVACACGASNLPTLAVGALEALVVVGTELGPTLNANQLHCAVPTARSSRSLAQLAWVDYSTLLHVAAGEGTHVLAI